MELSPEIFEPLFEALTEAPQTLPELLARPALAAIGGPHVRQSLNLLYAVGLLEAGPAEPPAAPRTAAFNDAVLRRAATMAEMQALASPVTGAGLKVNRQGMLWLLARRSGAPDPVAFSLNVMRALGINQFRGEERVEGEAENYALLRERMEDFATNQLPILRQLQMV
jgi:hypothetical protein